MSAERRLIWSLAWRFVRGHRTRLLAGTTWAALLATALGVAAMVIAMALMTGYRHDLQAKLVEGGAAVVAYPLREIEPSTVERYRAELLEVDNVRSADLVVYGQASLSSAGRPDGLDVMLRGIDPTADLSEICALEMLPAPAGAASVARLVVGRDLWGELEAERDGALRLMALTLSEGRPRFRYRSASVTATCSTGFSEFDSHWVLMDRADLRELLGTASQDVLEIAVTRLEQTTEAASAAKQILGSDYLISDYYDLNRELFTALKLQQLMLFLVLGLIVFVSTFNTASSLVVMVRERRRDLGVLSALGLSAAAHRGVFLRYGLMLGTAGTVIGLAVGALAAWSMNEFELIRFDSEVAAIYFLSAVPFRLATRDLAAVAFFTLFVTLVACWLPARRAGRIQPADALRYE